MAIYKQIYRKNGSNAAAISTSYDWASAYRYRMTNLNRARYGALNTLRIINNSSEDIVISFTFDVARTNSRLIKANSISNINVDDGINFYGFDIYNTDTTTDVAIGEVTFIVAKVNQEKGEIKMTEDSVYSPLGTDISTGEIVTGAVTTAKIADTAVTTAKIADAAVTDVKLSVSHLWQLVDEIVTGTTASDITFSGLDLETDKIYIVVIRKLINSTGTGLDLYLYVNGDTTAANYLTGIMWESSDSISTHDYNTPIITPFGGNGHCSGIIFITKTAGDNPKAISNTITINSSNVPATSMSGWRHSNTTNVTSITLHATASSFSAGATISLYKG